LLERAARLSEARGGGSLTALPIIETQANDVSAYIPTNVISITDGQMFLESDLFYAGVRPALNVGISVSRVGGDAQIRAMRQVAGQLRLDLAQYRSLEAFAQFGTEDLDTATRRQLERGARMTEILKQPQFRPFPVEHQVAALFAASRGFIDDTEVNQVQRFRGEFLEYMESSHRDLLDQIVAAGRIDDDLDAALQKAVQDFMSTFTA
jgi:F-type H+-transporting ATPase subunit alpha